jgi:hypothetical protein
LKAQVLLRKDRPDQGSLEPSDRWHHLKDAGKRLRGRKLLKPTLYSLDLLRVRPWVMDPSLAERLWRVSEKPTGVLFPDCG